jgi:hypothetical protein
MPHSASTTPQHRGSAKLTTECLVKTSREFLGYLGDRVAQ